MASQDWFEKDFYAILGVPADADLRIEPRGIAPDQPRLLGLLPGYPLWRKHPNGLRGSVHLCGCTPHRESLL